MPKRPPNTQDPDTGMFAALELLIQKGYDSTSVDELADAAGISRSTFFRRFGSKEDMLFADHDWILSRVAENLAESRREPLATISAAVLLVFNHHVRNRDYALLRHELLQRVELLRNRELITSHRYEQCFRSHLMAALPPQSNQEYLAVAYAAAVVAVHNRLLRRWFAEARNEVEDILDRKLTDSLERELRRLAEIFRSAIFPREDDVKGRPSVLVTVLDAEASRADIIESIRDALL